MLNEGKFQAFDRVIAMLVECIGSHLIAWDELEDHLKSGRIRGVATFNKLHELTQQIIAREDRKIPLGWWNTQGRFGRLHGRPILWMDVDIIELNSWADLSNIDRAPTFSVTDVMLWMPDVLHLYPDLNQSATNEIQPGKAALKGRFADADYPLVQEMRQLRVSGSAHSDNAAAEQVVGRAAGAGTRDSKIRRLRNAYKSLFSSKN